MPTTNAWDVRERLPIVSLSLTSVELQLRSNPLKGRLALP